MTDVIERERERERERRRERERERERGETRAFSKLFKYHLSLSKNLHATKTVKQSLPGSS